MAELPRITLVTPSFNQGQFIGQTLDSVLSQGYPALDYIVIDGGSTDGSAEIIKRHAKHLSHWVSEPDLGQSDALIKGFAQANGTLMNWINADDLLRPGALKAVAEVWMEQPADLIVGEDLQFKEDVARPVGHFKPAGYRFPDCLRFWTGDFHYHQPPTYFSRHAYERCGGLRRDLHYVMDFDLYARMLALPGVKVRYVDHVLSAFRLHPATKTVRAKARFLRELSAVSRPLWPRDWDAAREQRAMDRYCAECSLFQAAESLRALQLGATGRAVVAALHYAPMHAASFALQRGLGHRRG